MNPTREKRTRQLSVTLTQTEVSLLEGIANEKSCSLASVLRQGVMEMITSKSDRVTVAIRDRVETIQESVSRIVSSLPATIKTREELWEEFLEDLPLLDSETFWKSVHDGDGSVAHEYLYTWILGYQSGVELSKPDQEWLESKMSQAIKEWKEDED